MKLLSAQSIEQSISQGHLIVIHEGHALQLDRWIDKHPGGRLSILHMVGRDATDEINVYHFAKTLRVMKAYRIGRIEQPWTNLEPPIRAGKITAVEKNYTEASPSTKLERDPEKDVVVPTEEPLRKRCKLRCIFASTPKTDEQVTEKTSLLSDTEQEEREQLLPMPTRSDYIAGLELKEINDGISEFPSLDPETQHAITLEYRALHERIKNDGLYSCRYSEYGKELIRYSLLFTCFILLLRAGWYLSSAVLLGMFWQQIMFTAHDAGHRGISGNFIIDTLIGTFVADFCCGLSIGWWKSSHNVHHLVTNMPEHDPDLQNVPLFATTPSYFRTTLSTFYNFTFVWDKAADIMIPYQKYTYYPIMALARFNLYFLSWCHLCSPRAANLGSAWWTRPVELVFMTCYWILFGYCLVWKTLPDWPTRVAFVLISHIVTMLLHVQITLSHWGMPTADLGPTESFPQRQLRTTMDVDCPAWLDFLHGGLQFQAVHHLFPRVPRHNLRQVQTLVREFSQKTKVEYHCYGFMEGNGIVLSRLEEVAKMVETLVKCQDHMAKTWDSGLH